MKDMILKVPYIKEQRLNSKSKKKKMKKNLFFVN
jgi:hypothetical protein